MKRLVGIAASKPKQTNKTKGFVFYDGVSSLDNNPIVVIGTLETSNAKTGDMVQVWILRSDMNPVEASKTKQDNAICGNCPHKHNIGGACYVNIGQAPNAVYKTYKAGKYPTYNKEQHEHLLQHRKIRLGAYGDPAAAPFEIMEYLAHVGIGHTGYTHQIRHKHFDDRFLSICMVSADSPNQALQYQEKGARTFRVAMVGDAMYDNEIECLSDSKGMQCLDCGLCDGNKRNSANIVIAVHGTKKNNFKTSTLIKLVNV